MSGVIDLLPLYAFKAWTWKTLLLHGAFYFHMVWQAIEGFNDRVFQSTKMVSSPVA